MALKNLLFVDDDPSVLRICQRHFQRELTPNVDVADNYASALESIRKTNYDLIILDGLGGDCFRVHKDIAAMSHGDVVIFSGNTDVEKKARELGISFYEKPKDIDKLIDRYKE